MKEIKLTQGKVALVDDEDFESLSEWKWHYSKSDENRGYAKTHIGGGRKHKNVVYMHRFILNVDESTEVDHKDRNTLNNQRFNLRICTDGQNAFNRSKTKKTTSSKYIGVSWYKPLSKWRAYVSVNKKQHHVGYFDLITDAVIMRDKKAQELHGEFANLNEIQS